MKEEMKSKTVSEEDEPWLLKGIVFKLTTKRLGKQEPQVQLVAVEHLPVINENISSPKKDTKWGRTNQLTNRESEL